MSTSPSDREAIALKQTGLPGGITPGFIIVLAVLLGGALRSILVLRADFPHNDGGLFYTFTQEIIANGFRLPATSGYNGTGMALVYPPLAFYLAGLLHVGTGIPLTELERFLPLIFSILTIPAFALLSRTILKDSVTAALAALGFALLYNSFDRLLMGGGLPRAPGFFFALLALNSIYSLFEKAKRRDFFLAIIFSALTMLSHPVYTWFVAYSAGIFFIFLPSKRRNLGSALIVAAGVLVICAPWLVTILNMHGFSPLSGAVLSRGRFPLIIPLLQLLSFDLSRESFLEILGVISLFGLLVTLHKRQYIFAGWLLAVFLLERTSPVALAVIPLALLAGIGGQELIAAFQPWLETRPGRRLFLIGFPLLIFYSLTSSYLAFNASVLTPEARLAMDWAARNTSPGSKFLVLSTYPWWDDPATEWFPALTGRISVTTVQGFEWTSRRDFELRAQQYDAVRDCLATIETKCLQEWSDAYRTDFDFIFIPGLGARNGQTILDATPLVQSLRSSGEYDAVYDRPGGVILVRR